MSNRTSPLASSEQPSPTQRRVLAGYAATVFVSSALLLVLEIVAGRLIAPYVGVSLYTWTSIIGVILAGLSLGNWIGGVWADRGGNGSSVGLVLAAGGIYCILSLAMLDALGEAIQQQGTTLLTCPSFAVDGIAMIALPPLLRAVPRIKSICPPIPL